MVDEANLDKWIDKIDEDGSGSIECEEFLSIFNGLNQKNAMNLDQLLLETFQLVSNNRCCCVSCLVANFDAFLPHAFFIYPTLPSKLFSMMLMDREISIRLN